MNKDRLKKSTPSSQKLQEGVDFYLENGYYVFTGKFLRERGYCCKSGCRHCPYGFSKDGEADNDIKEA